MKRRSLIGTIGVAAKDIETCDGIIKKGTKVKIVDVGMFCFDLIVEDGHRIIESSFDSVVINEE